jgi:quercetin dioxygenase-like cupin family protein
MVNVEKLEEMVEYQNQSVVSRTLIDKPVGTITLFAFDKGEGLSEHTTPYDALVYIYDGKAIITISGKEYEVEKGDTLIMPANDPHALRAVTRFKMMLIMIRS